MKKWKKKRKHTSRITCSTDKAVPEKNRDVFMPTKFVKHLRSAYNNDFGTPEDSNRPSNDCKKAWASSMKIQRLVSIQTSPVPSSFSCFKIWSFVSVSTKRQKSRNSWQTNLFHKVFDFIWMIIWDFENLKQSLKKNVFSKNFFWKRLSISPL